MRIVVDSNVIVSAFIYPSSELAAIITQWEAGNLDLLFADEMLDELGDVLRRPHIVAIHGQSELDIQRFLARFGQHGVSIKPDRTLRVVFADPKDDIFVQTAIAGGAEYIISGDKHLLAIGEHRGIRIVAPATFLAIIG